MFKDTAVLDRPVTEDNEEDGIYQPDENRDIKSDFVEQLKRAPIMIIDRNPELMSLDHISSLAPADKQIIVIDCNINDMFATKDENGIRINEPKLNKDAISIEGGFRVGNVTNIDHHFPTPEFSAQISSTNLAIEYVRKYGPAAMDTTVIINHTDCDSILASAIIRGILPPDYIFGFSAIAADHTGEPDEIADFLGEVNDVKDEDMSGNLRLEFALRNLQLLLDGKQLEPLAQKMLENRINNRELAKSVIQDIKISESGNLYYIYLNNKIDSTLLPALLPKAKIVLTFSRDSGLPEGTFVAKVRLGMAAPEGSDTRVIMKNVDPKYGGRWNAGSNKRMGGTILDIETYSKRLDEEATKYFERIEAGMRF